MNLIGIIFFLTILNQALSKRDACQSMIPDDYDPLIQPTTGLQIDLDYVIMDIPNVDEQEHVSQL